MGMMAPEQMMGPPGMGPGGPPPPGGPPGGIPPEIMALMAGQGGPGGPPPGPPGPPPPEEGGSPTDILEEMSRLGQRYTGNQKDQEDRASMAKIIAQLMSLLAKEQKEMDAAIGAGPAVRMMRRG